MNKQGSRRPPTYLTQQALLDELAAVRARKAASRPGLTLLEYYASQETRRHRWRAIGQALAWLAAVAVLVAVWSMR